MQRLGGLPSDGSYLIGAASRSLESEKSKQGAIQVIGSPDKRSEKTIRFDMRLSAALQFCESQSSNFSLLELPIA